jgi:hypothetical protein
MFGDESGASFMLSPKTSHIVDSKSTPSVSHNIPRCDIVTQLVVDGLLSDKTPVRQTAASLVFNMGLYCHQQKKKDANALHDENWIFESVGALLSAIETEEDFESSKSNCSSI